jgi:hypothetical protein
MGTAVAQWLRYCATNQKVAGSIPDGVNFSFHKSFWSQYGPGVDSASNRNEYQENFLGVNAAGVYGWPYHHPGPLSRNLRTLTSWNPLGHPRPVTGLLYLLTYGVITAYSTSLAICCRTHCRRKAPTKRIWQIKLLFCCRICKTYTISVQGTSVIKMAVLISEEWKHEDKKEKSVGVTNDYELETSSTK